MTNQNVITSLPIYIVPRTGTFIKKLISPLISYAFYMGKLFRILLQFVATLIHVFLRGKFGFRKMPLDEL